MSLVLKLLVIWEFCFPRRRVRLVGRVFSLGYGILRAALKPAEWNWVEGWENAGIVYAGKKANEE